MNHIVKLPDVTYAYLIELAKDMGMIVDEYCKVFLPAMIMAMHIMIIGQPIVEENSSPYASLTMEEDDKLKS